MAKVDLAALREKSRFRTPENLGPEATFITPHGQAGTGKTTLWGQFGKGEKAKALLVQGEKGDRDLDNPDIQIIDINNMFNIGVVGDLKVTGEGEVEGDIDNLDNSAMGWDMVKAITDDLIRTGGRTFNAEGKRFTHVIFDSGTTFQKMCLASVMKNNPTRKRPGNGNRPSLEDYGEAVLEFDDWLIKLRDLKAMGITVVCIFLTQELKYMELAPDGFNTIETVRYMPMVFGKKLPTQIVSYADFAPFHQQVEQTIMVDDPNNPGKKVPRVQQIRGLRWHPTSKIFAKGRGKLPETHGLLAPRDRLEEGGEPVGWKCHEINLQRICKAGNIPM